MSRLEGRTALITGGSRGIGRAIATRFAAEGANVVLIGKTDTPQAARPETVHEAAAQINALPGGRALAVPADVRDDAAIQGAVAQAVEAFGGLDIVINNASAINLTSTGDIDLRRFDLMYGVNVRGTLAVTQACLPHLRVSSAPHVLVMAPPLERLPEFFRAHTPYSLTKTGMSLCVLGFAEEFRDWSIPVNALWPRSLIATAALRMLSDQDLSKHARTPAIVADAAVELVTDPDRPTGGFFTDEAVLAKAGVRDLSPYAVDPTADLILDYA